MIALVLFYAFWRFIKTQKTLLPPGPIRLPFIGTIYKHGLYISSKQLTEMSKTYGSIFSIWIGQRQCVVLNGHSVINEAVQKPIDFGHRGISGIFTWKILSVDIRGIFRRDYDATLITLRNKAMASLRSLAIEHKFTDTIIAEENQKLLDMLSNNQETPFNIRNTLEDTLTSTMIRLLFGMKLETHDFEEFKRQSNEVYSNVLFLFALNHLRFLQYIPFLRKLILKVSNALNNSHRFIQKKSSQSLFHHKQFKDDYNTTCFISLYANRTFKDRIDQAAKCPEMTAMLQDFLIAGPHGLVLTLEWLIVFLANRQDIQKKVQDEIHNEIGFEKQATFSDYCNKRLPYLEATLMETLRFSSLSPIMVYMSNSTKDVELGGYTIPKQTVVLINNHSVNHSASVQDHDQFKPERFLDRSNNITDGQRYFLFGAGKRTCVGEVLARRIVFVFAANIFQRFTVAVPDGIDRIDETPDEAIIWRPKSFYVKLTRNNGGLSSSC